MAYLSWGTMLVLAAVFAYGVRTNHLLEQRLWTRQGLIRLAGVLIIYALTATAYFFWHPMKFGFHLTSVAIFYAMVSVGIAAPGAIVLILLSSFAMGNMVLAAGRRRGTTLCGSLLDILIGLAIFTFLVGIAAHYSINYPSVYWIGVTLPLIWNRSGVVRILRTVARQSPQIILDAPTFWCQAVFGFFALAYLLVAMKPEVGHDALLMHLAVPESVAAHHRWDFDFRHMVWAVMPMGGDWIYTIAYMTGGEYSARLFNFALVLIICGLLYATLRRSLPSSTAFIFVALFLSCPLAYLETGSLFIENALAATILGAVVALYVFWRAGRARDLFATAILGGISLQIKLAALGPCLFILAAAIFVVYKRRHLKTPKPVELVLAAVVALLFGSPPYLYAAMRTGNPIFPFMNAVFKSPYYDTAVSFSNPLFRQKLTWHTLYDVTFHSSRYLESQDGSIGFAFLFFVPLVLIGLLARGSLWGWLTFVIGAGGTLAVFHSEPYLRYVYPGLPVFYLCLGDVIGAARRHEPKFYRALSALALVLCCLDIYFLPSSSWSNGGFFINYLTGTRESEEYIKSFAPARKAVEYLNVFAPGEPVGFFGVPQVAGLYGEAFTANWHNYDYNRQLTECRTPEQILAVLKRFGIRYFLFRNEGLAESTSAFLERFTRVTFSYAGVSVSKLVQVPISRGPEMLSNANFQKGFQDWQVNGAVRFSSVEQSMRVTLRDTLIQRIPIDATEIYRYTMEARCEGNANALRLQINWHDSHDSFVGTSIVPLSCDATFRTYTALMNPPPTSTSGVVFVGGHTEFPVYVRSISVTQEN